MKKIITILNLIFRIKYEFKLPKKHRILFLKKHNLDLFKKHIFLSEINFIDYPDSINITVLFKSFFLKKTKNIYLNYLINYIEESDPKIIISFIDNHYPYYLLKNFFKSKKFIIIQNGYRGGDADFFDKHKIKNYSNMNMKADYILTFNESTGKEFKKYVDCENITIGSFRNNIFPISKKKYKNSLAFISSYDPKREMLCEIDGKKLFSNDFFFLEEILIKFLLDYCVKKSLDFYIIPRIKNNDVNNFLLQFDKSKNKIHILEKKDRYINYQYLDEFDYLAGTETTMTYEALARKQKIAIFCLRGSILKKKMPGIDLNFDQYNFLWPGNSNITGKYWTHLNDKETMTKILDFVTNCTDQEWYNELNKINSNDLILHDLGNTKLKNLINKSI